jgi:hypothetical protein
MHEVSRLSKTTVHHVYVKPPEPEKLRAPRFTIGPLPVCDLAELKGRSGRRVAEALNIAA